MLTGAAGMATVVAAAWLPFFLADPGTSNALRFTIADTELSALRVLGVHDARTPPLTLAYVVACAALLPTRSGAGAFSDRSGPTCEAPVMKVARRTANKVPEVTVYFWIIKVLAATVGETAADLLNMNRLRALGPVPAFWAAYVLTRPLGASLGDRLSQSRDAGGLGLGTVGPSVVFLLASVLLVVHLTRSRVDVVDERAGGPGEPVPINARTYP
ncbi:hypothetical protein ACQEVZ_47210 [Dactylosporangium sp. CA-152071]|uniref:hypothetical protein n=1 Tax=Dactylosporangium sp. CA-152071 TaxID=3239933 RepID=UPI003D8D536E